MAQDLALPIDIPWKRLAVSEDMLDRHFNDAKFPPKWRSSVAIFYYEPEPTEQNCDTTLTYIKISSSITGFQLEPDEASPEWDVRKLESEEAIVDDGLTKVFLENVFDKVVGTYYPCYGALLHVAVFPTAARMSCVRIAEHSQSNTENPKWTIRGVRFGYQDNRELEIRALGRDLPRGLYLDAGLEISFPATSYVEVTVYQASQGQGVIVIPHGDSVVALQEARVREPLQEYTITVRGKDLTALSLKPHGTTILTQVCLCADDAIEAPDDFPYIMDFEPKKREVYEAVTETGEVLSGSATTVQVTKGDTSTRSTEDFSSFGADFGLGLKVGPVDMGGSIGAQTGSRVTNATERVNLRTADESREKRESFSHSANITQMYQIFNGYHIGTNRALFLISPRPHMVDLTEDSHPVRTFVNGPRRLEGIQDVFLVVSWPKNSKGLCIEALLETSHVTWKTETKAETKQQGPSTEMLSRFLNGKYGRAQKEYTYYNTNDQAAYTHVILELYYHPGGPIATGPEQGHDAPEGFRSLGYRKENESIQQDFAWATVPEVLDDYFENHPDRKPNEIITEETTASMWLTARSASACLPICGDGTEAVTPLEPSTGEPVTFETSFRVPGNVVSAAGANETQRRVTDLMQTSLGSRHRFALNRKGFLDTKYVNGIVKAVFPEVGTSATFRSMLHEIVEKAAKEPRLAGAIPDASDAHQRKSKYE